MAAPCHSIIFHVGSWCEGTCFNTYVLNVRWESAAQESQRLTTCCVPQLFLELMRHLLQNNPMMYEGPGVETRVATESITGTNVCCLPAHSVEMIFVLAQSYSVNVRNYFTDEV